MTEPAIPSRFPATGNDIATGVVRAVSQHMELGCRLIFDVRLDADVLRRAVRLSLDAEPVLGCAYRTSALKAWWERLGDAALPFSVMQTTDAEAECRRFQSEHVDDDGPQVAVRLLQGPERDTISVRLNHTAADGQATKQYAYLLADLYSRLLDDQGYRPAPNLRPRPASGDVWRGLSAEQRSAAGRSPKMTMPNWELPRRAVTGRGRTFDELVVARERFLAIRRWGQERDATVNDLLLAAFFRALTAAWTPPSRRAMSLPFSAEHRRYLPDPTGLPISNLAITIWLGVAYAPGESFEGTLARVCEQTAAWRAALWGVKDAAGATRFSSLGPGVMGAVLGSINRLSARSARTSPVFTNIGVVDDGMLAFGTAVPVAARLSGPAAFGASFVPTISTYRDELTVSMGYCAEDMDAGAIRGVLDVMESGLSELG